MILDKWVLKRAFKLQSRKPKDFSHLSYAFTDSNGLKYYEFNEMFECGLERLDALMIKISEMNARLSGDELSALIDSLKVAFQSKIEQGEVPDLAWIGHFISEMEFRKEHIFIHTAYLDIAALFYIREDEEPTKVDDEIQTEKVKQFKKDYVANTEFFFTQKLSAYLGFTEPTENELREQFLKCQSHLKKMRDQTELYLSESK